MRFEGIAQAVLPPAYFLDFYQSLALPRGTEVTLFRDDRAVVVRYPAVPDELAVKLDKWTAPPPGWGEAECGTRPCRIRGGRRRAGGKLAPGRADSRFT